MTHTDNTKNEQTLKQRTGTYCIRSFSCRSVTVQTGRKMEICQMHQII